MSIFTAITGNKRIRALRKIDFEVIRIKGSHHFLQHADGRCRVVPVHRGPGAGENGLTEVKLDVRRQL